MRSIVTTLITGVAFAKDERHDSTGQGGTSPSLVKSRDKSGRRDSLCRR